MTKPGNRVLRATGGAVLLAALTAALAGTALAHPYGTPPTAVLYGHDRTVVIEWESAADDAIAIGVHLGLLAPETITRYTLGASDQPPLAADEQLLSRSPELRDYVLEHIAVLQDGQPCAATVRPIANFVNSGVTVVHECPAPVESVDVRISMLHDVHEAYRTFAGGVTGTSPKQAVFTRDTAQQTWTFGVTSAPGWSAHPAVVAALVLGIAGVAANRWRQRRTRGRAVPARPGRSGSRSRDVLRTGVHGVAPVGVLAAVEPEPFGWLEAEFIRLMDGQASSVALAIVALAIAFGIGAVHALGPGHGKALIGAYLVGTRGRARDAVALGTVVAGMHCASVLVLGGVLFATVSVRTDVGQLMPWMSVAAGALITSVGAGLLARHVRLRASRPALLTAGAGGGPGAGARGHAHDHAHHQGHGHGHGHFHHDLPEGVSPLSRRGIVALGVSGGLLPSPSAFIVLATGILMGRALFGFLLVSAFSVGLASTLTAFGLAAVKGRTLIERRASGSPRLARLIAVLPLLTAVAVLGGGVWITTTALLRL